GVPLDMDALRAAAERNVPIIGEMELAARFFKTPIIAVTGTNGKTTAVSLLGEMIERSGRKVFVGGNIGTPAIDYAAGKQDCDYAVLEVSSFQLDTIETFNPMIAVIMNITPDHLERYADFNAYVHSKLRIFENQGRGAYSVLNDDNEVLRDYEMQEGPTLLRYGMKSAMGRRHAYMDGRRLIAGLPGKEEVSFDTDGFLLPGTHNIENLMGVVLAAMAAGVDQETIQSCITSFRGLPHRIEHAGDIKGVAFYDDSKATNVDAALRAIKSFDRPVILIAGGRHKGGEYRPMVDASLGRVKGAILMGESRQLMADAFEGVVPCVFAKDMREAVSIAFGLAVKGDIVLLAPACSSFDMFTDYAHRGNVFKREVERLRDVG
ncbi:MAG: UDP-N-acetylmuramoyl-L-alanine--D-glutamate ligase, partial [Deltaproteobacteria bacterium]|nr:UDP-N-acetylmuramoyl-L-alanine--D-glutamate ligase [Deltaproteobacteria bacterium]